MNRTSAIAAAFLAAAVLTAQAPVKRTLAQTLERTFTGVEGEFVPAVEAMPEAQFAFAPTQGEFKGVRTFAAQAKHVAAVNYQVAAAILGEKVPAEAAEDDGPAAMTAKGEIVGFVKGSFTYAHKALGTLTDQNALEPIKSPWGSGTTSRLALSGILLGHVFDHYGQMVVYLRMNGIVPPASRK